MDLVAGDGLAEGDTPAGAGDLRRFEAGDGGKAAETGHRTGGALDRVVDRSGRASGTRRRSRGRWRTGAVAATAASSPAGPQPGEVGHRGLGPGQDHEVRCAERGAMGDVAHADAGLEGQGVDIGEVGDAGEADDGDVEDVAPPAPGRRNPTAPAAPGCPRRRGGGRRPRAARRGWERRCGPELVQPRLEQRRVAPELVDDKGFHAAPEVVGEERHRPEQRGEDPAPVDVADDDGRDARRRGPATG